MEGDNIMPNIRPITDLQNYNEVLGEITVGNPVFLTQNGADRYAIIDMVDYKKILSTIEIMKALSSAKESTEDSGWVSETEVRKILGINI